MFVIDLGSINILFYSVIPLIKLLSSSTGNNMLIKKHEINLITKTNNYLKIEYFEDLYYNSFIDLEIPTICVKFSTNEESANFSINYYSSDILDDNFLRKNI